MEAICSQCHMRYEVGEDLLQTAAEVKCPTCQVVLSFVQPGEAAQAPDSTVDQTTERPKNEPTDETTHEASFEAPVWDGSTEKPATQDFAAQASFEETGSGEPDQSADPVEKQLKTGEPPSVEKTQGISTEQVEDWAEAAARWATSGFSAEQVPWFVKNDASSKAKERTGSPPSEDQTQASESRSDQFKEEVCQESLQVKSSSEEVSERQFVTAGAGEGVTSVVDHMERDAQGGNQPADSTIKTHVPPPLPKGSIAVASGDQASCEDTKVESKPMQSVYVMRGSGEGTREKPHPWHKNDEVDAGKTDPPSETSPDEQEVLKQASSEISLFESKTTGTKQRSWFDLPDTVPRMSFKHNRTGLWLVLAAVMLAVGGLAAWYLPDIKKFFELDDQKTMVASSSSSDDRQATGRLEPVDSLGGKTDFLDQREEPVDHTGRSSGGENQSQPTSRRSSRDIDVADGKKDAKGNKHLDTGAKRKAAANLKRAIQFTKQGYGLIKKKKYIEAVKRFQKALKINPTYPTPHRGLGICYAQLGRHKQACSEYRTYLRMIPPGSKEAVKLKAILKDCK